MRNEVPDYGLLGDVFMEQGRLDEAVVFYQRMVNLRPDLQYFAELTQRSCRSQRWWVRVEPRKSCLLLRNLFAARTGLVLL